MAADYPKLVCIVGETASGKTEMALRLAKQFNGEIICADSWTVRREANIGTAKPTTEERTMVPHHLLDIVRPDEDFTAAVFKDLANRAIEDISKRGKLPVMVGGTGLYVDAVLYDYSFLPAGDRDEREKLNSMSISELLQTIDKLELDPGDVDVRNKRRLIRLIETNGAWPTRQKLRPNTLILGLRLDREELRQRIERRVDAMLAAGLEDEVRQLVERYGWDCEALKGVGYAQWRGHLEGQETIEEAHQKIIKATLDLAKRQRTWFKRNKSIQWVSTPVKWSKVVELVTTKNYN
ncbi:MAG TPA: tRNA (adenosine(37)-N6)-dimethylallyltransferase MiaA [Candidatus Saccharimonadales bacterium]|jgi:tRNA dimethylallyltransferase|nr:tRNA (adenosine(37)-N6)-dimethylallyltransferase MiaA [Candidatus Saccharimonadales bacterium]